MQAQGFRIADNHRLESVPPDRVRDDWMAGGASFWLDIEGNCHEALERYLHEVEISPILLQLCEEDTEEIARVIPTDSAIFFSLPVGSEADDEPTGYLTAICLPRLLITLHPRPNDSLQTLVKALQYTTVLTAPTTSALVCVMLMYFSSQSILLAQKVLRRVGKLTEEMDRDVNTVVLEQLLAEKAVVRGLYALDDESSPVYAILKVSDNAALNLSELESYYQVVLSNTNFLTRSVDRLDSRLDDLHQRYVVNMQEKTNQRLAFLTVVSAIFLPLTLLAGIYGMNFENMPELRIPYAYPVALGIMAAIAIGMWRYFKRKRWFD